MICEKCGSMVPDSSAFCFACGNKFWTDEEKEQMSLYGEPNSDDYSDEDETFSEETEKVRIRKSTIDYEKSRIFFFGAGSHVGSVFLFIFGGIISIIGLSFRAVGAVAIGLILIAVGVIIIVAQNRKNVHENEYDALCRDVINNIDEKAMQKLGIKADEAVKIPPVTFDGYVYKNAIYARLGRDGMWRTNRYEAVRLFFSEEEIYCYHYSFDTLKGDFTEATYEFFYKDIVSVGIVSETVRACRRMISSEYFDLATVVGGAIRVSLRDAADAQAQASVNAIRALVREKRQ